MRHRSWICIAVVGLSAMSFIAGCGKDDVVDADVDTLVTEPYTPHYLYCTNAMSNTVSQYQITAGGGLAVLGSPNTVATGTGPRNIVVDPTGRYAYVTNEGANSISTYTIDSSSGALTPYGAQVSTGIKPFSIRIAASGRFLLVTNLNDTTMCSYAIDANGALTEQGTRVRTPVKSFCVAIHPNDHFAYAVGGNGLVGGDSLGRIYQYSIDSTGILTPLTPISINGALAPTCVVVDSTGTYAFVSSVGDNRITTYRIAATGELSFYDSLTVPGVAPFSISLNSSGTRLYSVAEVSNTLIVYTIAAGHLTLQGAPVATGNFPYHVILDPSGRYAYSVNNASATLSQFRLDAQGGLSAEIAAPIATGLKPAWAAVK